MINHMSRVQNQTQIQINQVAVLEIAAGHWPFSDQFDHLADI